MKALFCVFVFFLTNFMLAPFVAAGPVLSPDQWRSDLKQAIKAIEDIHPDPFSKISKADFDRATGQLNKEIPALRDKEIIVRLAELVALIGDGHTRLSILAQYPELLASTSHSADRPVNFDALQFRRLPVRFARFDDGLFIVAATPGHAGLVGSRVEAFGGTASEEAWQMVSRGVSSGNDSLPKFLIPSRLELIDYLAAKKITPSSDRVALRLESKTAGGREIVLEAMAPGAEIEWITNERGSVSALRSSRPDEKY